MIAVLQMVRRRLGIIVPRRPRSSLIPIPSDSPIVRLAEYLQENSRSLRRPAKFHSRILTVSIHYISHRTLAGRQALDRSDQGLITRRSAADHITPLLRRTARIRMRFTIARKIWSLRFVCAAMTAAPRMGHQCQLTRRSAAGYMGMLKSHPTEQFIFPITVVVAQAP